MARIRSIKPEFWVSEQIAECSTNARLTFVGLWNFSDDNGVHPAKPKTLKAELYPMDDCTSVQVGEWMGELIAAGLVGEFEDSATREKYWFVTGWARHQKIDRPSFKYPAPPEISESHPRVIDDDSSNARRAPPPGVDRKGVDRTGVEGRSPKAPRTTRASKTAIPADFTVSEHVRTWAKSKGFGDLEQHLEAFKGKAAANAYRYDDWDAAFMNAIRDDWAKVRTGSTHSRGGRGPVLGSDDVFEAAP